MDGLPIGDAALVLQNGTSRTERAADVVAAIEPVTYPGRDAY